jgi:hypothetical protein
MLIDLYQCCNSSCSLPYPFLRSTTPQTHELVEEGPASLFSSTNIFKLATQMSRSFSIEAGLSVRDMDNAFVISKRYMPIAIVLVREEE